MFASHFSGARGLKQHQRNEYPHPPPTPPKKLKPQRSERAPYRNKCPAHPQPPDSSRFLRGGGAEVSEHKGSFILEVFSALILCLSKKKTEHNLNIVVCSGLGLWDSGSSGCALQVSGLPTGFSFLFPSC